MEVNHLRYPPPLVLNTNFIPSLLLRSLVFVFTGYYGDGFNALIVFAACYLPDRSRKDYQYVMDNLFL